MRFTKESVIRAPRERVFGFYMRPDAFQLLVPPWEKVKMVQLADISKIGSRAIIRSKILGFLPVRWVAEHTAYDPPHMFEDVQVSGPFASWRHRHVFDAVPGGTLMRDEIEYEPPTGSLGKFAAPMLIVPKLEKMFSYRHEVVRRWCEEGLQER
jgi:ligand-binding SRPBCC domain-containing protein